MTTSAAAALKVADSVRGVDSWHNPEKAIEAFHHGLKGTSSARADGGDGVGRQRASTAFCATKRIVSNARGGNSVRARLMERTLQQNTDASDADTSWYL